MKLAIVHDYLNQYGGAERVLEAVHEIWPEAKVHTLFHDFKKLAKFKTWKVTPTFAQRLPFLKTHYEKYFPLFPTAIEQLDLTEFDVVVSISSAWAKGVITLPHTLHICYLLNPMRFAWEEYYSRVERIPRMLRVPFRILMNYIRIWDVVSSQRVDSFITLSSTVRKRALKYYNRDSVIIYPPCDTSFFTPNPNLKVQDFFLIISRLKPYKRIELAIKAFNEMGLPLLIIGEGEERGYLEKIARPNVQFLGRISDEETRSYFQRTQALIFPTLEDFGIVPVEAQACGTPVIAFKEGGALETVIEGKTGTFFFPQTKEALIEKIKSFDRSKFNPETLRNHALKFDKEVFKRQIKDFVMAEYEKHKSSISDS